ncbi:MAG: hypothetical protein AAGA18_00385 [Verrucomicrobiota bacterium]
MIARFGHHLGLQWNLREENDTHRRNELNHKAQVRVKTYAQYFNDHAPYSHLFTIRSYASRRERNTVYKPLLGDKSLLTGTSIQTNMADFSNVFEEISLLSPENVGSFIATSQG